jgi:hypothetical protein
MDKILSELKTTKGRFPEKDLNDVVSESEEEVEKVMPSGRNYRSFKIEQYEL